MKIKTKKRINVCGAWYTVVFEKFDGEDEADYGQCSYNDRKIRINEEVPENRVESIVAHEICHAVLDQHRIDVLLEKYVSEEVRSEIEEAICRAMENGYKAFRNI